ncbi:zinc ribbon domain-containing protein [Nonomuraea sp. NPDC050691]|uniref:zinc ribbon domain-containing protein n=1 Tax=Nonomuraea sp. NPDC050691 TaxID=3155661 RepID=UPI0033C7B8A1
MFLTILAYKAESAGLAYKAESAGRELIAVEPRNTSRACSRCGHCARENRVTQAAFRCRGCGHAAHADANAAINILRAGLALRQAAEAAQREAASFRERRSHQPARSLAGGSSVR